MAAVTRLGLHGGPRGLYGSFEGKELAPEVEPEVAQPSGGWIRQQDEESTGQRKARILKERIDLGIIAAPELPVIALKATGPDKRQILALDERERLLTYLEAMAEQDAQRDNLRRKHTALLLLLV
jgi:hypothetical protein